MERNKTDKMNQMCFLSTGKLWTSDIAILRSVYFPSVFKGNAVFAPKSVFKRKKCLLFLLQHIKCLLDNYSKHFDGIEYLTE